jgi:pyrroloquinoline quinone biosynthesis protein D
MTDRGQAWGLPGQYPCLAAGARLQTDRVRDAEVLLYPEGVLLLNPTAAAALALCDGRRCFAEIVADLVDRYPVCRDELARDLGEFLSRLRERGLLRETLVEGGT